MPANVPAIAAEAVFFRNLLVKAVEINVLKAIAAENRNTINSISLSELNCSWISQAPKDNNPAVITKTAKLWKILPDSIERGFLNNAIAHIIARTIKQA